MTALRILICMLCLAAPAEAQQSFSNYLNGLPSTILPGATDKLYILQGSTPRSIAPSALIGAISVIGYGAKCDGVTNDTTAFNNAWSAAAAAGGGLITVPGGVTCLGNFSFSGNNVTLAGAGVQGTILKSFASGNLISVSNSNFSRITGFSLQPGSFGSGAAIAEANTVDNLKIDHVAIGVFTYGVQCNGTVGAQTSGNDFTDNFILSNGSTTTSLSYTYCNDFHILNNQFGQASGAVTFAGHGVQLTNSNAGQVKGNFIWQNTIGMEIDSSNENWVSDNRFTQSQQQGFIANGAVRLTFQSNQLYQNSNASVGAVESAKFVGLVASVINGNLFYDWSGTNHVNYHLTLDATSGDISILGNWFDSFVTSQPLNISPTPFDVVLKGNVPTQNAYTNSAPSSSLLKHSSAIGQYTASTASGVGGAGSTIFVGLSGANASEGSAGVIPITTAGIITCFTVINGTAPGAGQSFTYNLRYNSGATSLSGSASGASTFRTDVCSQANAQVVNPGSTIDLQIVSSAGAAASQFWATITEDQ